MGIALPFPPTLGAVAAGPGVSSLSFLQRLFDLPRYRACVMPNKSCYKISIQAYKMLRLCQR